MNGATTTTTVENETAVSEAELGRALRGFLSDSGGGGGGRGVVVRPPVHPILPAADGDNVLITSALPYVNNVPHLGNVVGCVLSADVFARFCRLRGRNALFVCGTDEYGTSTETKALQEGLTPRQICDKYHALHKEIYDWFEISFDAFGRTTTEKQTEVAQKIFWDLDEQGMLNEDTMDQLFCVKCQKFLADRFVEGICPTCKFEDARGDQCDGCGKLINATELIEPRCKVCSARPEVRTSRHIFIDLPKVETRLHEWFNKASEGWTSNAQGIAKSWLSGGLQPRCITRDLKWGTQVPKKGYEDKVFYVWFDAPIGYVSITANYTDQWEKWWKNPSQVTHYEFMAKDNVPFHAVVFPSTQLGTGQPWTMVDHLMATEYLNYEDTKFSKSRGIGVFGDQARETGLSSDIWRFYLMYTRPEGADSFFKWDDLLAKTNFELLGNFGNFVNRALKFCKDNFNGVVPGIRLSADDQLFVAHVSRHLSKYIELMEVAKERDSISEVLRISRLGNQLIQANTPWKLVKSPRAELRARAGSVIALSVNTVALLSTLITPFMPAMAKKMREQLNMSEIPVLTDTFRCFLPPGHTIGSPAPLVEEIKKDKMEELKKRFGGNQNATNGNAVEVPSGPDPIKAKELEKSVSQQGDVVRKLKEAKADKDVIKPEVEKLLALKNALAIAEGKDPAAGKAPSKSKGKKKK